MTTTILVRHLPKRWTAREGPAPDAGLQKMLLLTLVRTRGSREALLGLHRYLAREFPTVHAALERETVGQLSALYTWQGTSPALKPILLIGHIDVVPVEGGSKSSWTHPPFAGVVADGFIWGGGPEANSPT